ncbi:cyclin-H-like [Babylonia areolata]|uniref:cyclin-H-like n=1 Tax=Babylonia areolata TaxID=304850 RepID=UPI003FCF5251
MFATSTQLNYWTFSGETELRQLRQEANQNFVQTHGKHMSEQERAAFFLSPPEERLLLRQYEYVLKEFCNKFNPPLPKCILGTSLAFLKRFWINNSPMDYHPKDIMLTAVYLACKVEEFYVPISQFVSNLKGNREKFADTILTFELLLMSKLRYHLTVHNPFRAMEGLLIDVKTRFPELENAERLRRNAEEFIDRALMTDIVLIFSPSQIALAALLYSAGKEMVNLDRYVMDILMGGSSGEEIKKLIYQLKRIKHMVKTDPVIPREQVSTIQKKLERCRNQENNPESDSYKARMAERFDDEDLQKSHKRARIQEEERKRDLELVS